jgi:hypothetical protein
MSYGSFSSNYNKNPLANFGSALGGASNKASGFMSKFRNNKVVGGSVDFLYSNSLVAKVCFLILIIVIFVIALRLGSRLVMWALSTDKNPILVKGFIDASDPGTSGTVVMDPKLTGAKPIVRSVNEREGIEFTYSVWLYVTNYSINQGSKRHIFNKGSSKNVSGKSSFDAGGTNIDTTGMNFPNNAPGVYFKANDDKNGSNQLAIYMNTFNNVIEEVTIKDLPVKKWFNLTIRVRHDKMDTYINGTIVNRHKFSSPVKQNYGNVYVCQNGGFAGNLSNLRYYSYGLSGVQINDLVAAGPDLTPNDTMKIFPYYFSLRWFFKKPQLASGAQ